MSVSIAPLVQESERVLTEAIRHFGLMVKPEQIVVTIQAAGRRNAIGWFGPQRWKNGQKEGIHEINLCAEWLKKHDMGETLIHELAHAENNTKGIMDCTASQRHNRKFKAMAEALGLVCEEKPHKRFGFGFTKLGNGAKEFLAKIEFKRDLFSCFRCRL